MEKQKLVLASNNKGKIREFREMFPDYDIVPYAELGITEEPNETGTTFFENAIIFLKYFIKIKFIKYKTTFFYERNELMI